MDKNDINPLDNFKRLQKQARSKTNNVKNIETQIKDILFDKSSNDKKNLNKLKKATKTKNTVKNIKAAKEELQITDNNDETASQKKKAVKKPLNGKRNTKVKRTAQKSNKQLKIIPLGGLETIGMNITAFEYDNSIVVVDCGLAFPDEDAPGIDLIIPDVSYLKDNIKKVKAFIITHGHEDHIGALPYILKEIKVPIYGTKLTLELIKRKFKEHGINEEKLLKLVSHGDSVSLGDFKIEFVKTNHSIQDASALAIFTPVGTIFHTGDFKIDYTPVFGEPADLQRMADIGKSGCLAIMCDSTNALKSGFTMSEKTVGKTFDSIFAENINKRIIVATFASNVDRVQQIINTACKYGRKVAIEGRSMVNVITTASSIGYIDIPKNTIVDVAALKNYKPENTVIITTGSQGESMAALSRMANATHKKVAINSNDVVIMSSTPIPGNEKAVYRVMNELSIKGAKLIFQDTHVSGHACQEEIKLIYSLLKPKFAIPIHGEYRHRLAQAEIAQSMGIDEGNIKIISSGDILGINEEGMNILGHIDVETVYVDGLGIGDVGSVVIRDRQNLAQNGIIIVTVVFGKGGYVASGPDIVSRGFVYVRESEDLLEGAKNTVSLFVDECMNKGIHDWSKIKAGIKDSLSSYIWKKIKREPVILPIIMEV